MVTRVTYGDKDRDKGGDGYTDRDEGWYSGNGGGGGGDRNS